MEYKDTLSNSENGTYTAIGLMSGTSLDGLDVAVCEFTCNPTWSGRILQLKMFDFPEGLHDELKISRSLSAEKLWKLDKRWAHFAAECVSQISAELLPFVQVVSSHGHTVFHNPQESYSVQIGSGAVLASQTNIPVVCDFRSLDIAYGGQGAPLVPFVDSVLFAEYTACLNLGGFANISVLPQAWDIGVCNNLLNLLAREKELQYDSEGKLAKSGKTIVDLLDELLSLNYHVLAPPKSLGVEWMDTDLCPLLEKYAHHSLEDRMRTAVEYIAITIVNDCPKSGVILVTGGGSFNCFLIQRMNELSHGVEFYLPESDMINGKEAFAFAFLGLQRWLGKSNVLKSATGASKASSGGAVWLP